VSDLLTAAAAALDTPEILVERSAAARAEANGTSVDDVLAAWAGGAPVTATAPPAAPEPVAAEETAQVAPASEEPVVAVIEVPAAAPEPVVVEQPTEEIEPVPMARRIRTATRVGAWTGAALGLFGFLVATTWWAADVSVTGDETYSPVIQADSTAVIIAVALVSLLFGAVVAGLSRAAAAWTNPGMRLSNSPRSTAWLGAFLGLALGVIAGALLTSSFGAEIDGAEGLIQLPVLPTLSIMIIGGAVLGAVTAAASQAVGVPVAIPEGDDREIEIVRTRLSGAIGIPLASLLLLLLLVLPFAWTLIESNRLTGGGAAIVATLTAIGVLMFASLAGSKPNMKISFGEFMVAVVGIGVVIVIVLLTLSAVNQAEDHEEGEAEAEAAIVLVVN
jgi:MFS family permease